MKLVEQGKKCLAVQRDLPLLLHFLQDDNGWIGQEIQHRLPRFYETRLDQVPKQGAFALSQIGLELAGLVGLEGFELDLERHSAVED